jgi:hypothetical protein
MGNIDTSHLKGITTLSNRLAKLEVLADTEHPILQAVWFKFSSNKFAKLGDGSVSIWVKGANKLNHFLLSRGYTSIETTPVTVFNEWAIALAQDEDSSKSYNQVRPFVTAAEGYFFDKGSLLSVDEYDFLSQVIQEFDIQRRGSKKKPPLSMMFPNCPYGDDELLVSLRLVCANIILLEQKAKDSILNQEYCGHFLKFECDSVSRPYYLHSFHSGHNECRTLMLPIFKAISKENNELAKECVLTEVFSNQNFNYNLNTSNLGDLYAEFISPKKMLVESPLSVAEVDEMKNKLEQSKPSMRELSEKYRCTEYDVKRSSKGRFPNAIPHDVAIKIRKEYSKPSYTHSDAQKEYGIKKHTLIRLLKCGGHSYKVVNSPSQSKYMTSRLNIDSIGLLGNSWTCGYFGISKLTSLNPTQEWALFCLLATEGVQTTGFENLRFADIKETASVSGTLTIQFDYIKNRAKATLSTALHSNKDNPNVFYLAYSCAVSQAKRSIKYRDPSERDKVFKTTRAALSKFLNNKNRGDHLRDRLLNSNSALRNVLHQQMTPEQLEPFLWLLERLKKSGKSLPISPIHESFVLVSSVNTTIGSHADAAASLSGHTKKTEEDIYYSRFPRIVKEKITDTPSLSYRVAEMMSNFADDINDMLSQTEVLSKSAVKNLLGLNHISDAVEGIGLLGEFESNQKTIYIATASTAALILRRLDHLKAEIPRIIQHQRSSRRIATGVLKEFIQLSEVLAKFPKNVLAQGEKHSKKLPSSLFPPIV